MQRRSFLGGLFGVSAIGATGVALSAPKKATGVLWRPVCPMEACKTQLEQFVELTGVPIQIGTQCPRCLAVLDNSGLADQIRAFNKQDKYGRPL